MASIAIPIVQVTYATGSNVVVDQAAVGSQASVSLNRCIPASALQWANVATIVEILIEASFDGGNTYSTLADATESGGIQNNAAGATRLTAFIAGGGQGVFDHIRVTLNVTVGPCLTSGSVSVQ